MAGFAFSSPKMLPYLCSDDNIDIGESDQMALFGSSLPRKSTLPVYNISQHDSRVFQRVGVVQIFGEFRIPTKYRTFCTGFLGVFKPVYGMTSVANTKTTSFPKIYYTPFFHYAAL